MKIREIKKGEAAALVELIKEVEKQSKYMLLEPGERTSGDRELESRIIEMKKVGNSTVFVAEEGNELIGYLMAIGGTAKRNKHSVYLVTGILDEYRGRGIGTELFKHLEEWRRGAEIERLELTVVTLNEAGIRLYKKMGFVVEGTKRKSLCINGEFVDEYYMSKIF
ncbi:GNAT family N-acetyltransferase [Mesobacillus foraminis]|uniref:RimJ/RimL family protein N-acetyltransferase n=1 Tax=Mesobacillus foraminis TaxID=279826 RepID=A0A4V2RDU1_9BACI|nr:GNAT family N-acetyltransferase [Mesobacillus foraminis]TCN26140.1 RimJ/RimL family protein N-acetyltransferase [Mesobacillus foraminis]